MKLHLNTRLSALALMSGSLLLFLGCNENRQTPEWTIEGDARLWALHELPANESDDPVIAKFYYDVRAERLYLKTSVFPADKALTFEDVNASHVQFYSIDSMGLSQEEAKPESRVGVVELEASEAMMLSSSLQRSIGNTSRQQPFGSLELFSRINESVYQIKRKAGFPFFGEDYTEQVGRGEVSLHLRSPVDGVIFSLTDTYDENSAEYTASFTPDGRYVVITLPDDPDHAAAQLPGSHRLILVGALPVGRDKQQIIGAIELSEQAKKESRARQLQLQKYRDGQIPPEDFFGKVYVTALNKITGCRDIQRIVGNIESLKVRESVLNFGNPTPVGKVFTFDYLASEGKGNMQVIVLGPENESRWATTYKPYLESIDVRTDDGVRYANCP